ncbi:TadE/TadG family type IV pilus assembly protein [Planctellipticum variicoloris]|uniref:TadE/TadG family type IV pilus assembly protein n=1 Tax=Planctellipticum variicoloris TaxID=3064265 RepID=UPI0030136C72|nr:pilus assembly protein TadG-related protein [Planctomycetaceae bacterium SH412]
MNGNLPAPNLLTAACRQGRGLVLRVHRDERGVISVLTVFATFLFTILLVMLINVGRQIDDKIRMQNAADASAYSGSVAIARGMNALAFSNHLLCEVFALTAYMREGRDQNAEKLVPEILQAWRVVGTQFWLGTGSRVHSQKFKLMGRAIVDKADVEQKMVDAFGALAHEQSRISLPLFEYILAGPNGQGDPLGGFIPRFQRAVVRATPILAETAVDDIVQRYGTSSQGIHENQPLRALLWRSNVLAVGYTDEDDPRARTVPALDPSPMGVDTMMPNLDEYFRRASDRRRSLAFFYLEDWIRHWQTKYFEYPTPSYSSREGDTTAKMSQYINLWRIFTCYQLNKLLDEYPNTNLPHMLRELDASTGGGCAGFDSQQQATLERDYQFVGTAYWPPLSTMFPGLFRNPLERDSRNYAVTFAQAEIYIPFRRYACCPWAYPVACTDENGQPATCWINQYDNWPHEWDLFNQNWTARLTPATAPSLIPVLQTHPSRYLTGSLTSYVPPRVGALSQTQLQIVSPH